MDSTAAGPIATLEILKTLADDRRLALVHLLAGREMCVCDIASELGLSDALVSHHLKRLRAAGLVRTRSVGQWLYCRVDPEALRALAGEIESLSREVRQAGECVSGARCCSGSTPRERRTGNE